MGRTLFFLIPQSFSLFGSSVLQFAIIWTLVYEYGTGTMLLLATLMGFLPQLVSSLLIGPALDRKSRRCLIAIPDGVSAAAAFAALLFFLNGKSDATILLPLLGVRSLCQGIQTPSYAAVLPLIVPEGQLMRVNGLKGLFSSLVMFLSPAVAGFLFSCSYGLIYSLSLDIVTAFAAIICILRLDIPMTAPAEAQGFSEGIRYAGKHRMIAFLILFNALSLFLISPGAFMTPLLISREYSGDPLMLSISEMSYSLGMIGGGALVTLIGENLGKRGYAIALAVYGLCLIAIGAVHSFPCYIVFNLLIGISSPFYTASINTAIQRRTEDGMMGRIMALLSFSSSLSLPLSMVLFGPLADIMSLRYVFMLSGMAAALCALAGYVRAGNDHPERQQE